MTFGSIFGALHFLLCAWVGLQFLASPETSTKIGGLLLAAFGVSMALGLLSRQDWARWSGIGGAVALAAIAWRLIDSRGTTIDFVLFMSSLATVVLLLVPATAPRERNQDDAIRGSRSGRLLASVASLSAVGLVFVFVWAYTADRSAEPSPVVIAGLDLPRRVQWIDYGTGLSLARAEDKPMLVSFVADWCGYCKKMDRETWTHPSVVERTNAFVPVEVDIDDTRQVNGFSGASLAGRYGISGTPTTMLIDGDGRVLAEAGGFLTPRQFLPWLEDSLSRVARGGASVVTP